MKLRQHLYGFVLCGSLIAFQGVYAKDLARKNGIPSFVVSLDSNEIQSNKPVIIPPLQSRQNIWMPWKRWKISDSTTWPIFDETQKEAGLILPLGNRPDGEFSIPDIAQLINGGVEIDTLHPFFNVLKILKLRKIKPAIDLGPIPSSLTAAPTAIPGMFQTIREGPKDYEVYYQYMSKFFAVLKSKNIYSLNEINKLEFQLYREPDNPEVFDPTHSSQLADFKNLTQYKILYDYTLAAMRNTGITANLSFGNLLIPIKGVLGSERSWMIPLIQFMGDTTVNYCPSHLILPRHKKSDSLRISFSAYGGAGTQLGLDPARLLEISQRIRTEAYKVCPSTPIALSVAEGGFFTGGVLHRGDGSARGAAWNAALFSFALASGIDRYQQWGWVSAKHTSQFWESKGLPGAHFHVAQFWSALSGSTWLKTNLQNIDTLPNRRIGLVAGKKSNSEIQILLFNYQFIAGASKDSVFEVIIKGKNIEQNWKATVTSLDDHHGSYFEAWHGIVKNSGLSLIQPNDACMEYQFDYKLQVLWDTNKSLLQGLTTVKETAFNFNFQKIKNGLVGDINLPPNSVAFIKLTRSRQSAKSSF